MEHIKIKDLKSGDKGFYIKVKVLEKTSDRIVTIKKTGMQNRVADFLIADDTGQLTLTVWGADIDQIPVDKTISIQKSYVSEFNNKLSLNIGKYSTWSRSKVEIIVDETPRPKTEPKVNSHIKVCNAPVKKKGINLEKVKVLEITNIRSVKVKRDGSDHEVADALVGDETGCIKCALWDEDIRKIKEDMILRIYNAYISEFRDVPQLNLSRFSKYEILEPEDLEVNLENNLSYREQAQA
ncbi:MAG: hypothetical protein ACFFD2_29850 [Promethearchaeota archaeon]